MEINSPFTSILIEIQLSNQNFSIQTTPFAAYITLRKNLQKDLNGDYAIPSPPTLLLLQETQWQLLYLQNENYSLKSTVAALEKKCEYIEQENANLLDAHEENNKIVEALEADNNILHQKINIAEREAAKKETEKIELGHKIKEMNKKHGQEMRDKKSKVKNLEDTTKRNKKDIHDLSRNLENVRSTEKTFNSKILN